MNWEEARVGSHVPNTTTQTFQVNRLRVVRLTQPMTHIQAEGLFVSTQARFRNAGGRTEPREN